SCRGEYLFCLADLLPEALSRGSPRTESNSGYVRSRPSRTDPRFAMRSSTSRVRSLSPKTYTHQVSSLNPDPGDYPLLLRIREAEYSIRPVIQVGATRHGLAEVER